MQTFSERLGFKEDRDKQRAAFAATADLLGLTPTEKAESLKGFDIFFDAGWPTNHFTSGMASRAAQGYLPERYTGFISVHHYKEMLKERGVPLPD